MITVTSNGHIYKNHLSTRLRVGLDKRTGERWLFNLDTQETLAVVTGRAWTNHKALHNLINKHLGE